MQKKYKVVLCLKRKKQYTYANYFYRANVMCYNTNIFKKNCCTKIDLNLDCSSLLGNIGPNTLLNALMMYSVVSIIPRRFKMYLYATHLVQSFFIVGKQTTIPHTPKKQLMIRHSRSTYVLYFHEMTKLHFETFLRSIFSTRTPH